MIFAEIKGVAKDFGRFLVCYVSLVIVCFSLVFVFNIHSYFPNLQKQAWIEACEDLGGFASIEVMSNKEISLRKSKQTYEEGIRNTQDLTCMGLARPAKFPDQRQEYFIKNFYFVKGD